MSISPKSEFYGAQLQAGWNTTGPIFLRCTCRRPAVLYVRNRRAGSQFQAAEVRAVELGRSARHHQSPDFGRGLCRQSRLRRNHFGDLNAVPLGTGYTPAVIAACLASVGGTKASATACTPDSSAHCGGAAVQYPISLLQLHR